MAEPKHIFLTCFVNLVQIECHTKGIRPKGGIPQVRVHGTRVHLSEFQFIKWVKYVGKLKHSVFKAAKNNLFPAYTLAVNRNPATGDFTSVRDAVDSLPPVNLVPVVIRIHAGVYKSVIRLNELGQHGFSCCDHVWLKFE